MKLWWIIHYLQVQLPFSSIELKYAFLSNCIIDTAPWPQNPVCLFICLFAPLYYVVNIATHSTNMRRSTRVSWASSIAISLIFNQIQLVSRWLTNLLVKMLKSKRTLRFDEKRGFLKRDFFSRKNHLLTFKKQTKHCDLTGKIIF